jgi:hypothetical protein
MNESFTPLRRLSHQPGRSQQRRDPGGRSLRSQRSFGKGLVNPSPPAASGAMTSSVSEPGQTATSAAGFFNRVPTMSNNSPCGREQRVPFDDLKLTGPKTFVKHKN